MSYKICLMVLGGLFACSLPKLQPISGNDTHFNDCSGGGTVTLHHGDGTSETHTLDYCQAYRFEATPGGDGIQGTGIISTYATNDPNWQLGSPTTFTFSLGTPGYVGTLTTAFANDQQPAGTVAIQFTNNDRPTRVYFDVVEGQSFTLSSPVYSAEAPDFTTSTLNGSGLPVVGGGVLDFQITVQVSAEPNACHEYAQAMFGCAAPGVFTSAQAIEDSCNTFEIEYVQQANCAGRYSEYLQCVGSSGSCDQCHSQFCAFNTCMCKYWPTGPACQAACS